MVDNIFFPSGNSVSPISYSQEQPAVIKIVGVGGGGCNVISRMINAGVEGVEFIAVNTDIQALRASLAPTKIQIGEKESRGLGVGGDPDRGRKSAEENIEGLKDAVKGADLVFVATGMGGGTGTGAAPIIAKIAREYGILTVGVVTKPFDFDGEVRMKQAEEGIKNIGQYADSLIVIPNEKVITMIDEKMSLQALYEIIDDVLRRSILAITDTIVKKGEINRDLADIRTVLKDSGTPLIGIGESPVSVAEAFDKALNSPLLDKYDISKATKALIILTTSPNAPGALFKEFKDAIKGCNMKHSHNLVGHIFDTRIDNMIKVTIVATGFNPPRRMPSEIKINPIAADLSSKSESFAPSQSELFAKNDNSDSININATADYFLRPAYESWKIKKLK